LFVKKTGRKKNSFTLGPFFFGSGFGFFRPPSSAALGDDGRNRAETAIFPLKTALDARMARQGPLGVRQKTLAFRPILGYKLDHAALKSSSRRGV
jgi:hypothetical protein